MPLPAQHTTQAKQHRNPYADIFTTQPYTPDSKEKEAALRAFFTNALPNAVETVFPAYDLEVAFEPTQLQQCYNATLICDDNTRVLIPYNRIVSDIIALALTLDETRRNNDATMRTAIKQCIAAGAPEWAAEEAVQATGTIYPHIVADVAQQCISREGEENAKGHFFRHGARLLAQAVLDVRAKDKTHETGIRLQDADLRVANGSFYITFHTPKQQFIDELLIVADGCFDDDFRPLMQWMQSATNVATYIEYTLLMQQLIDM